MSDLSDIQMGELGKVLREQMDSQMKEGKKENTLDSALIIAEELRNIVNVLRDIKRELEVICP